MPFRKKYWYWNIETRKPEFGRKSRSERLLGPYRSKREAQNAPQIIKERNAHWLGARQAEERERQRERREEAGGQEDKARKAAPTPRGQSGQKREKAGKPAEGRWPSWQEFLEEPSQRELDRERRSGGVRPPAFFPGSTSLGVVGDDEHGTFEERVARFQKARREFERQARADAQKNRAAQERADRQTGRALRENRRQAKGLLDEQKKTLPHLTGSLHAWGSKPSAKPRGQGR